MRLNVDWEAQPGAAILICGADEALGAWDLSKALPFQICEDRPSLWSCDLPVTSAPDFKLALRTVGGTTWEPLDNRVWPSSCLHEGTVLHTSFGDPKMTVEVSAAQIEAEARRTRDLKEREASALQANIDKKGDNAYYFAHNRAFEVPEHAKVISGPGLITGGAPTLVEAGAKKVDAEEVVNLKDYCWSDAGAKVKVYVTVREGTLPMEGADEITETNFTAKGAMLTIRSKPCQKLKLDRLNAEIKPDDCSVRVEPKKSRVTLQLVKKRDTTWYSLTTK